MVQFRRRKRQQRSLPTRRLISTTLCLIIFLSAYLMILDIISTRNITKERRNLSSMTEQAQQTQRLEIHQNVIIRDNTEKVWNPFLKEKKMHTEEDNIDNFFDRERQQRSNNEKDIIEVDLEDYSPLSPLQILLSAKVYLIDIYSTYAKHSIDVDDESSYHYSTGGIDAIFCELDFSKQRKDPSSVPMFRALVENSSNCQSGPRYKVDLKGFVDIARSHDAKLKSMGNHHLPKSLNLTGVVFHESRCGSTLVANALMAMNPDKHRVYSESTPPIKAMQHICGELYQHCSLSQAATVVKDVMYLMGRSNDMEENRVFFKIQSIGSLTINIFQHAYPDTPWVYIYRKPVQVMMSHFQNGVIHANCVQSRRIPSSLRSIISHHIEQYTPFSSLKELSDAQYCAAYLATLTHSAVNAIEQSVTSTTTASTKLMGRAINYEELPDILWNSVLPNHFGMGELSDDAIEGIKNISRIYSKGTHGRHGEFKEDSESKERNSTPEIRDAAKEFLQESYEKLLTYGFD